MILNLKNFIGCIFLVASFASQGLAKGMIKELAVSTSLLAPPGNANLSITNDVSNATPNVGSNVVFTLTVKNNGPGDATGVSVTDILPSGYTYVSHSGGTYNSVTGIWPIGNLANDASVSLQITVTVNAISFYSNTATVTGNEIDPVTSNNSATSTPVPVRITNLSITKSVNNATPPIGGNVVFTLTVFNNGPSNATGVSATDLLPSGYTYVSHTGGGTYISGTGSWTIGNLINGLSASLQITATVKATGSYANTATVTGAQTDLNLANNSATSTPVPVSVPLTDLSISKTVNNSAPSVGSNIIFTLSVTNNGPSAATGVSVTDLLPSGYTYVSHSGSGTYISGTGIWSIGILLNGASASLQITATVNASGSYSNTATVTGTQSDPNMTNNSASSTPTPVPITNLSVLKSVSNATPFVGSNVVFTLTASNAGPSMATGVTVTDLLPSGYIYVSDNGGGVYNSGTGVWTIGNITNGANASLQITATVKASGSYMNTATVTGTQNDPNLTNNSASATTTPVPATNLSISKSVDNASPLIGSTIVFTITVSNAGPSAATGVTVTDLMPSGYSYISDDGSGAYTNGSGIWTISNLLNGTTSTLHITALVNTTGNYTNTATVSGSQTDPVLTNNSASVSTLPFSSYSFADISVNKTVDDLNPFAGASIAFTVAIHNYGPDDATGVVVTEVLPSGYSYSSATSTSGSYNPVSGLWSVGTLANNAADTLTVNVIVSESGPYANTAFIYANETDPFMANNSSTITPDVRYHNLIIPNAFSPNSDGVNDVFEIKGLDKYPNNTLSLFNRWGNKVFEAKGYKNDWDGSTNFGITVGGNFLPVGTYFYVLDLGESENTNDQVVKGTLYLNR